MHRKCCCSAYRYATKYDQRTSEQPSRTRRTARRTNAVQKSYARVQIFFKRCGKIASSERGKILFSPSTGGTSPDRDARRLTSQRGAGGGGSMGHSRWRALRGYLIWSQKRLRTAAARKPGTRQMISSTDLNPAEAAVCKSREDPTAVRHGRPGLPCTQLDCAACVKAHKRAAWGCARACFSPAPLATA